MPHVQFGGDDDDEATGETDVMDEARLARATAGGARYVVTQKANGEVRAFARARALRSPPREREIDKRSGRVLLPLNPVLGVIARWRCRVPQMFTASVVHATDPRAADPAGPEPAAGAPALYWVVVVRAVCVRHVVSVSLTLCARATWFSRVGEQEQQVWRVGGPHGAALAA